MNNPISSRIDRIKSGDDPQLLARVPSGFAILANAQPEPITGCCMLLPDPTPASLNDLGPAAREQFLGDLALLGDAVLAATGCERVNYLILCNQVPWLHAHVVPRFATEEPALRLKGPFEAYDFAKARHADALGQDRELHAKLKRALESSLANVR